MKGGGNLIIGAAFYIDGGGGGGGGAAAPIQRYGRSATLAEMANHAFVYLSWSEQLQALFCFPCRLFSTNDSLIKSSLASPRGWSANCGPKWKKLYDRLTEHENSASHQQCYLSWRDVQRSLTNESAVDIMLPLANDFEKADTRSFLSVRKRSPFQRRLV